MIRELFEMLKYKYYIIYLLILSTAEEECTECGLPCGKIWTNCGGTEKGGDVYHVYMIDKRLCGNKYLKKHMH